MDIKDLPQGYEVSISQTSEGGFRKPNSPWTVCITKPKACSECGQWEEGPPWAKGFGETIEIAFNIAWVEMCKYEVLTERGWKDPITKEPIKRKLW